MKIHVCIYSNMCVYIHIMNMLPCMYFKFVLWLGIPALLVAKFLRTVLHLEVYISRWLFTPRNLGPWFNHYLSWGHASIKNIFQCIRNFASLYFGTVLFFRVASLNRPWRSGLGRWKFLLGWPIHGSSAIHRRLHLKMEREAMRPEVKKKETTITENSEN